MKIDLSTLAGYRPEMTADEKLALVEAHEIPEPDHAGFIKKDAFDRTASEAADWKRKYNSKLTEDEKKEAEHAAKEAEREAELQTLRKENAVTKHKSELMALGYDEKLATDTANALADGDMAKVFANQKVYIENVRKSERAAVLAGSEEPPAGQNKAPKGRDALIAQYNEAEKKGDVAAMLRLDAQIKNIPKE